MDLTDVEGLEPNINIDDIINSFMRFKELDIDLGAMGVEGLEPDIIVD